MRTAALPNLSGHHFPGDSSRDQRSHEPVLGNVNLSFQHIVPGPFDTKQSKRALSCRDGRAAGPRRGARQKEVRGLKACSGISVIQRAEPQTEWPRAKKTNEEWPNKHSQLNIR